MSIKGVDWARRQLGRTWEEVDPKTGELRPRKLGATHILALVEMGDCINKHMTFAFPGPERLEKATGLGERQQRRLIRDLEASGAIKAVQGKGRGRGRGREPNRYYLAVDPKTGLDRPLPAEAFAGPARSLESEVEAAQNRAVTAGQNCPPVKPLQPVAGDTYTRSRATAAPLYEHNPEGNRDAETEKRADTQVAKSFGLQGLGKAGGLPKPVRLDPQERDRRIEELRQMAEAEKAGGAS